MKGEYLSKVIVVEEDLVADKLNLIAAGCGAGKTTFAIKKLAKKYGNDKTAFLIDTKRGREQLTKKEECTDLWTASKMAQLMPTEIFDEWIDTQIKVMTYSQFAYRYRTEECFLNQFDCIICDEIHNLANFMTWDDQVGRCSSEFSDNYLAYELICGLVQQTDCMTVAMSATPDKFLDRFKRHELVNWVHPDVEFRHYETDEIINYSNISVLLAELDDEKRGIVYVPRIRMIKATVEQLNKRGIKAVGIWSENNKEHKMNKEQNDVSDYLVDNAEIPEDVQVLVINKSSETSINIDTYVDYIVVHSMEEDVRIQVRGRLRRDLRTMYYYNPSSEKYNNIKIADKWLDMRLSKADKMEICKESGITYRGKPVKWTTFKKIINNSITYKVTERKSDGVRYDIITEEL